MRSDRAVRWYRRLLGLYPREFREQFAESMAQTFNDLLNERIGTRQSLSRFVIQTFADTSGEAVRERIVSSMTMTNIASRPRTAALAGAFFAMPFMFLNMVVARQQEPFYSWMRYWGLNNVGGFGAGFYVISAVLLLLPAGAFVAVRPLFRRQEGKKRQWCVLNLAVAAVLVAGFVTLTAVIGEEVYRCDVLKLENCD